MFEQMQMVQKRYQELTRLLADPAVLADGARYTQVNREWKSLSPLMDTYQSYRSAQLSLEETRQLLQEPDLDPELAALAKEELAAWQEQSETLAQQLQLLLLPQGPAGRQKRDFGDPGRGRGRGSRSVCPQPAADVHHVRRPPELEN